MDVHAEEGQENQWDNISNITQLNEISAIELNSVDETLFVRRSLEILEYGLINTSPIDSIWPDDSDFFYDMDWNNDYQKMAYAHSGSFASPSNLWNSPLVILDRNGVPIEGMTPYGRIPEHPSNIADIEWRPRSNHLAIGFHDGILQIINCSDGSVISRHSFQHPIKRCLWNPTGSLLAVIITDMMNITDKLYIWDISYNNSWRTGGSWTIFDIDWSYDSRYLFVSENKMIHMLDVANGTSEDIWDSGGWFISTNPIDPIMVIHGYWSVNILNYYTKQVGTYYSYHEQLSFSDWTQDGSYFFTLDDADVIHIWTGKSTVPRPRVGIRTPNPDAIASGSIDIEGWAESTAPSTLSVIIRIGQNDWSLANGSIEWNFEYNTARTPDGPLMIRVKAIDYSGFSDVRIIRIFINNTVPNLDTPPTISIQSPDNGSIVWGVVEIIGKAVDDKAIESIQIRIDRSEWNPVEISQYQSVMNWTHHIDIMTELESTLEIQARAYDGYHFSEIAYVQVEIRPPSPDGLPLIVDILFPTPGITVPKDFTILGRIEQGRAEEIFVSIDNGKIYVIPGTDSWQITFYDVQEGPHFLSVIARNDEKWSQWIILSFFVDESIPMENQPPIIGIISPINDSSIDTDFSIIGWSIDDTEVVENEILINGNWTMVNGTYQWQFNISIDALSEGWIEFKVRAFDGSQFSEPMSVRLLILKEEDDNNGVKVPSKNYLYVIGLLIVIIVILSGYIMIMNKR